jgi:hypothetical protein
LIAEAISGRAGQDGVAVTLRAWVMNIGISRRGVFDD